MPSAARLWVGTLARSASLKATRPVSIRVNPMMVASSVVLPTPFRPNSAIDEFAGSDSDTCSSTTLPA